MVQNKGSLRGEKTLFTKGRGNADNAEFNDFRTGGGNRLMKKVCVFHFPRMENFYGYSIDSLAPAPYFRHSDFVFARWARVMRSQTLVEAKSVDRMYRRRDPAYMRFVGDFVDKFRDADLVIMSTYNPIHPDILYHELKKPIKVLGFVDEPDSTYTRGIPYLWAFDGAFYITPSFNHDTLFPDALRRWGCEQFYWYPNVLPMPETPGQMGFWPLAAPRERARQQGDRFFRDRPLDLIYVGNQYFNKMDRLVRLKRAFGSRFRIHGRWPLAGFGGMLPLLAGKSPLWSRVRSISDQERMDHYCSTKIGFNMHLSERPAETGNKRLYEVPAHGMMLLCDKAGLNGHEQLFVPDKEAVFYDSIEDAIDKIEYYLAHDEEREKIARAGFARVHSDYEEEKNLKNLLDWAIALPKRTPSMVSVPASLTENV